MHPFAWLDLRCRPADGKAVLDHGIAWGDSRERDLVTGRNFATCLVRMADSEMIAGRERIDCDRNVIGGMDAHDAMSAGRCHALLALYADGHPAGSSASVLSSGVLPTLYVSRARSYASARPIS